MKAKDNAGLEKKKGNPLKAVLGIVVVLVVSGVGYTFGVSGNSPRYDIESVLASHNKPQSPLAGKTLVFLGSSVTYGLASFGTSFVDYLEAFDHVHCIKEAVSGTTLANSDSKSYVGRLSKLTGLSKVDYFVCQLSTNDVSFSKPFGVLSKSYERADFDTQTTIGAIEYIVSFVRDKWHCPVVFFTNHHYDSGAYDTLVKELYKVQIKWNIGIIDLWNDTGVTKVFNDHWYYRFLDAIHPSKAGYLNVYVPAFQNYLYQHIDEVQALPKSS